MDRERDAKSPPSEPGSGAALDPEAVVLTCPNCDARLEVRRCKLVCPRCHYFMSCAEYD